MSKFVMSLLLNSNIIIFNLNLLTLYYNINKVRFSNIIASYSELLY